MTHSHEGKTTVDRHQYQDILDNRLLKQIFQSNYYKYGQRNTENTVEEFMEKVALIREQIRDLGRESRNSNKEPNGKFQNGKE